METLNKFRNDNNVRYMKGLFRELTSQPHTALYTLKDSNFDNYPSLYCLYMEMSDPTEWKFANAYLDGWDHWENLCAAEWFKPYVERWRRELELKLKSEALARVMETAKGESRDSYRANTYILDHWKPEGAPKRGRPTKADIKDAAKRIAETNKRIKEDRERLGILH